MVRHRGSLGVDRLLERLDLAVQLGDTAAITRQVKQDLEDLLQTRQLCLADGFRQTRADRYARRLLHRDLDRGYTAVVMAWAPGQRTALHDHAGIWCVEGVLEGRMEVTQYDLVDKTSDAFRFVEKGSVRAAVGTAGCLIPPFEYHVLANALSDRPSITLHVYGGEMSYCHVFETRPDGWYERRRRALDYDD